MALESEVSFIRKQLKDKLPSKLRPVLERMLDYPFLYASAGGALHRLDTREPLLLAIILHHEKMLVAIHHKKKNAKRSRSEYRTS